LRFQLAASSVRHASANCLFGFFLSAFQSRDVFNRYESMPVYTLSAAHNVTIDSGPSVQHLCKRSATLRALHDIQKQMPIKETAHTSKPSAYLVTSAVALV
jgi:hypothetical protein